MEMIYTMVVTDLYGNLIWKESAPSGGSIGCSNGYFTFYKEPSIYSAYKIYSPNKGEMVSIEIEDD